MRVIGYMVMEDEKGKDEKVLAVLKTDPRMSEVRVVRLNYISRCRLCSLT